MKGGANMPKMERFTCLACNRQVTTRREYRGYSAVLGQICESCLSPKDKLIQFVIKNFLRRKNQPLGKKWLLENIPVEDSWDMLLNEQWIEVHEVSPHGDWATSYKLSEHVYNNLAT